MFARSPLLKGVCSNFVPFREDFFSEACKNNYNTFVFLQNITDTRLFKYTENFTTKQMKNFQIKQSDIFHISAQNIDCGGSNEYHKLCFWAEMRKIMYTPVDPSLHYIKVGFKGVNII